MGSRLLLVACLVSAITAPASAADAPPYDVPRVADVTIDGDPADWGDAGFRVEVLVGSGTPPPPSDFDPSFRLGWNERGLLVLAQVRDDHADEAADVDGLWRKDGIELFLADRRGGAEMVQLMLAPGLSDEFPEPRFSVHDKRRSAELRRTPYTPLVARTRTADGYVAEVLLPWEGLGIDAERGAVVGFQIYLSDTDGDARYRAQWAAGRETSNNTRNMNELRLATDASDPVSTVASATYDERFGGIDVVAVIAGDQPETVEVAIDGEAVGSAAVVPEDGRGAARLRLPIPPRGVGPRTLDVRIAGRNVASVDLPDADVIRARHLAELAPAAKPAVFSGDTFPTLEFNEPTWAERLIGRYTVATTFYDAALRAVEKPDKPGRYGAIATITGEHGNVLTRFVTLYRTAEPYHPWNDRFRGEVALPPELGIDAGVAAEQRKQVLNQLTWAFADHGHRSDWTARLLAGLAETPADAGEPRSWNDGEARNRQWWVDLKRALNGNAERFTTPLQRPHANAGGEAPTLRDGTATDAGMVPDTKARIDAVLTAWSNDTDEPFVACVVRNGVVVLHKAYGQRDGEPMTTQTQTWMASLTKLLSGTALMMLVDQGLVALDDPAEKYLPELAAASPTPATPATLHHLVTHTAGLWGHWGDDVNDFEHRVAELYPHLAVGQKHEYNGASLALASKVIEQVTGEALPGFYRKHLTGPLGMEHTDVSDSAGGARSVARDMAVFGQMLLNRGAYGEHRFISEATFEQMLPRKLDVLLGPETEVVWGVGCTFFPEHGLSERAFGHGAASNATLRIDPEHNLIISMTRETAGRNFGVYHPRFIRTVVECIAE